MTTLQEAQATLRTQLMAGEAVECPCCTQLAKIYRRRIHSTMARHLILMYRTAGVGEWFHMPTVLGGHFGDAAKLGHWGLIEEETARREDGGRAGWWRVTPRGAAFVLGTYTVEEYARIYDGRLMGFEGRNVGIRDCLGSKFDYRELMAS